MTMAYEIGHELAPLVGPSLRRLDIAYMAVAMDDPNEVHTEDEVARASGMPQVIAHGTFPLAYGGAALTREFGFGAVRQYGLRLTAPVFPGDELTTNLLVSEVEDVESGQRLTLDVTVRKQDDTVVGRGSAQVVVS